jgi:chemotaxis protein MotB
MARKKGQEEEGANWMDTYGDMITLVLTFFVLLYSMSTMDKSKWQYIAQAFSAGEGKITNVVVVNEPDPDNDPSAIYVDDVDVEEAETVEFEYLYQYLKEYVQSNNLSDSVTVEMSKTGVYMKFRDNIFFAGDSAVLLDEGKYVLESISDGIRAVNERILAIKVSGHTAGSSTSDVNEWELSSGRADAVINYMLSLDVCDPEKFSSAGYAKYRPIAGNDTEENRAKNRRVEIVFIRNDVDFSDPEVVEELLSLEFGNNFVMPSNEDGSVQTEAAETEAAVSENSGKEYVSKSEALRTIKGNTQAADAENTDSEKQE